MVGIELNAARADMLRRNIDVVRAHLAGGVGRERGPSFADVELVWHPGLMTAETDSGHRRQRYLRLFNKKETSRDK